MKQILSAKSITEWHRMFGGEPPKHPLVCVYNHADLKADHNFIGQPITASHYTVMLKAGEACKMGYGRNTYDYDEGTIVFLAPGQVIQVDSWDASKVGDGWSLEFHPDLLRKSPLGQKMDSYTFFSYEVHEALHVSEEEKHKLFNLVSEIKKEYSANIDRHSQSLIISNIELLLNYCTRFYDRQFYVRENLNKDIVSRFEQLLKDYYSATKQEQNGLPTVKYCGESLNFSPNYLSDLLKRETGRNAQEHIHYFVMEKAKNMLLGSNEQINQIAFALGFEHPPHFSKLFKSKVGMSPNQYRNAG